MTRSDLPYLCSTGREGCAGSRTAKGCTSCAKELLAKALYESYEWGRRYGGPGPAEWEEIKCNWPDMAKDFYRRAAALLAKLEAI